MGTSRADRRACVLVAGHPVARGRGFRAAADQFVAAAREGEPGLDFVVAAATDAASLGRAIEARAGRPIVVLPVLMNHGGAYDTVRRVVAARPGVRLCRPLGTAAAVADIARDMALAACRTRGWRASRTTLLLVAHGARRDPRAQAPAVRHAAQIAAAGPFARVETAFLEAEPSFRAWLDRPGAPTIVVGLFLGRGRHVVEDVEQAIAHARPTIAYGGSVGDSAAIVSLGLRRIRRVLR